MDFTFLLIALGFILCGVICGFPIGYLLGRNSVWKEIEIPLKITVNPPKKVPINIHRGSGEAIVECFEVEQ